MTTTFTIEKTIHFQRQGRGRQELHAGKAPPTVTTPSERVPRVARLMALALRFDNLLRSGQIRDQAELARLGRVTRARISQILSLIHLAPDIQEELLFLQGGHRGGDLLIADLQPLTRQPDWQAQRRLWRRRKR